VRKAIWRRCV